ncbi:MAG: trehalose-phosphatase [Gammaproteobacteria bacterium]
MTAAGPRDVVSGPPESQAEEILRRLGGRQLVVLLDYDGTLSPIAPRPEDAALPAETRRVLGDLGERYRTAIISGRSLADLRDLIGIEPLIYVGNHGLEIQGPPGSGIHRNLAEDFVADVAAAAGELKTSLADIDGSLVEDKRYSLSVHYRLVAPEDVAAVESAVDAAVARHPRLEKRHGKKVFELRPALEWDKGKAVRWLLELVDGADAGMLPVYLGDDVTDEDAFRELTDDGVGVLVSEEARETAATHRLRDTGEVRRFLARLAEGPAR